MNTQPLKRTLALVLLFCAPPAIAGPVGDGAAANGDFSARGDADPFQFDFRVMVESPNQLMTTADGNLQSLPVLLQSIANGA